MTWLRLLNVINHSMSLCVVFVLSSRRLYVSIESSKPHIATRLAASGGRRAPLRAQPRWCNIPIYSNPNLDEVCSCYNKEVLRSSLSFLSSVRMAPPPFLNSRIRSRGGQCILRTCWQNPSRSKRGPFQFPNIFSTLRSFRRYPSSPRTHPSQY